LQIFNLFENYFLQDPAKCSGPLHVKQGLSHAVYAPKGQWRTMVWINMLKCW